MSKIRELTDYKNTTVRVGDIVTFKLVRNLGTSNEGYEILTDEVTGLEENPNVSSYFDFRTRRFKNSKIPSTAIITVSPSPRRSRTTGASKYERLGYLMAGASMRL